MSNQPRSISTFILIAVICVLATFLLLDHRNSLNADLPGNQGGKIQAIPVQIKPGFEAIALIDQDQQTLCLYQYQAHKPPHQALTLLAVRSYQWDVLLEDYNNDGPRPGEVRDIVRRTLSNPVREESSTKTHQDTIPEPKKTPKNHRKTFRL